MRKKNTAASLDHRRFAVAGLIRIWRSDRGIYLPISKIARAPRSTLRTFFEKPPAVTASIGAARGGHGRKRDADRP
jgi:hypothetical protein